MQSGLSSSSLPSATFDGVIWGLLVSDEGDKLLIDCRKQASKSIQLYLLDICSLKKEKMNIEIQWEEKPVGLGSDSLYLISYEDANDPNSFRYCSVNTNTGERKFIPEFSSNAPLVAEPFVYEHGSAYHKTVEKFLSMELPLSCEYHECGDKIIISYYLRSGKNYNRFLLCIEGGVKRWKVMQDTAMKGFAPGAFFVKDERVIFVKDQHEVCLFPI
ncbi:MAG: hypothetical protein Tsb0034_12110 [Ekhidna sp.]